MADMDFFADFEKLWGATGTTEPITQDQYQLGWSYIGALPPAVEQFNKVQQLEDEKVKWLYTQIKTYAAAHGIPLNALTTDALGLSLTHALSSVTTPPQFDNDTSIATTAFVQRALGNFPSEAIVSADITLTAAHAGKLIVGNSATAFTVTLPLASTIPNGTTFWFMNSGVGNMTITKQGTDIIDGLSGFNTTTLTIHNTLYVDASSNTWRAFGGSAQMQIVGTATPPQFDNDSSIASTAFVQRALGGMSASNSYGTAGQTIPASQANSVINLYGTCTSITLPLASSVPRGTVIEFAATSLTCTINRQGSDTIYGNSGNASITSVQITDGGNLRFITSSTSTWLVVGSAALKYSSDFGVSLAANGYQKLPSGLIIQWGIVTSSASVDVIVTYPIAFPTAVKTVVIGSILAGSGAYANVNSQGLTIFNLAGWSAISTRASFGVNWLAIGN